MKLRLVVAAVTLLFLGVLTMTPASAQYVGGTPPKAGPVASPGGENHGGATPVNVESGHQSRSTGFALTGADITQLVLIGGVFVVGGAVLVYRGRRRVVAGAS